MGTIYEVYVDLYFLINVSMDLLCLMITASLLHRPVKRRRVCLGAAIGGVYAVAALLLSLDGLLGFLLDVSVAVLMCTTVFYVKKIPFIQILKATFVQMLTSMILGGVMTALYSLLNRLHLPFDDLQGDSLSVWSFALITAVASIVTLRGGRFLGLSQKAKSLTLRAVLFGHEVVLQAFVDSGNLLRDPVSGKSVIVAELSRVADALPPLLLRAYETQDFSAVLSDYELAKRLRPIPTRTASGESLLFAIQPESLSLTEGQRTFPADYLIAPTSLGNTANGFDALISLE